MRLPKGFTASGVACGLKPSGNLDLGILASDRPAAAAAVFTTNRVQAAPVRVSKRLARAGRARAVVVNAGNANACTGAQGMADAEEMAASAAQALELRRGQALVASTGIIGVPLDMEAVRRGVADAARALSRSGADAFARAIMTTDTRPKTARASLEGGASLVGFAKGAGMIAPEMATLLAFVASDANVEARFLQRALREATAETFNSISVDGCGSTNDTLLVLTNGAAGGPVLRGGDAASNSFARALHDVCAALARRVVEDGEGATKVVTIRVRSAASVEEARRAARAIADSVLFRCALNGGDPNWGRVLAALGAARIRLDPDAVDVTLGGQLLCRGGATGPGSKAKAAAALQRREVEVVVDLHRGDATSTLLTNDLSAEYVRINAEYTT